MNETEWILELTITELYDLRDILPYNNLLMQTSGNQRKLDTAKVIRQKVVALIEELETETEIENDSVYSE